MLQEDVKIPINSSIPYKLNMFSWPKAGAANDAGGGGHCYGGLLPGMGHGSEEPLAQLRVQRTWRQTRFKTQELN
jgi:hypothetical protein